VRLLNEVSRVLRLYYYSRRRRNRPSESADNTRIARTNRIQRHLSLPRVL
jgi:hypothetical protein